MILENFWSNFSILDYWFFQKALIVSIITAISCAIIGTFIVVKRISMITGSISHATFGGLGISFYFGFNPIIGAMLFGVACGGSIGFLQKKNKNRLDTILSFLWAFGMAIGILFVYMKPGYSADLFTYLFGNIFLISNNEMLYSILINLFVLWVMFFLFNTFTMVLFDEEFAEVRNMPVLLTYLIFYVLIALTIVTILMVVGVILLIAFLTIPPAIALFYFKTIKKIILASGIILVVSNILGLFLGHWLSLPPGPVIILLLSMLYLGSFLLDHFKNQKRKKIEKIQSHACELELESFGIMNKYLDNPKQNTIN
jgi:zinc transport system permease protein